MTQPTLRSIARGTLFFSAGMNVFNIVEALARGRVEAAAWNSLILVILGAWAWQIPKLDALLDARLAEAIAQRDTAQAIFAEFDRQRRQGELHMAVSMEGKVDRVN